MLGSRQRFALPLAALAAAALAAGCGGDDGGGSGGSPSAPSVSEPSNKLTDDARDKVDEAITKGREGDQKGAEAGDPRGLRRAGQGPALRRQRAARDRDLRGHGQVAPDAQRSTGSGATASASSGAIASAATSP